MMRNARNACTMVVASFQGTGVMKFSIEIPITFGQQRDVIGDWTKDWVNAAQVARKAVNQAYADLCEAKANELRQVDDWRNAKEMLRLESLARSFREEDYDSFKYDKRREQTRERVRRFRERKKQSLNQ